VFEASKRSAAYRARTFGLARSTCGLVGFANPFPPALRVSAVTRLAVGIHASDRAGNGFTHALVDEELVRLKPNESEHSRYRRHEGGQHNRTSMGGHEVSGALEIRATFVTRTQEILLNPPSRMNPRLRSSRDRSKEERETFLVS